MPSSTTVPYNTWSPWYRFGQLFEYRGLVDETDKTKRRRKKVTWKGSAGFMHRDNGFRLRSFDYTSGSFSNMPLWVPLEDLPCPLSKGDLGVYWLKIKTDQGQYNYIGLSGSGQTAIFKRLVDHFTKIAGTFEHSAGFKDTENFKDFREDMEEFYRDADSPDFFEKRVEIAFVKVKSKKLTPKEINKIKNNITKEFESKFIELTPQIDDVIKSMAKQACKNKSRELTLEKVAKIEGMAIQAFQDKYDHPPELNFRDETIGLEGMKLLFDE